MINPLIERLRGGLVVSCQALENEPLHGSEIMARMSIAAEQGGAVGIRANSPEDIRSIKAVTKLPIIGIWKKDYPASEVYITPTFADAEAVIHAGADVVAMDATSRARPQEDLNAIVQLVKKRHRVLLMADVSTLEEGIDAERIGFDLVSTTLAGYTTYSRKLKGPDFMLVSELASKLSVPVIAEGRIQTPGQAFRCFEAGCYSVVVGGAITRPVSITSRFVTAISRRKKKLEE